MAAPTTTPDPLASDGSLTRLLLTMAARRSRAMRSHVSLAHHPADMLIWRDSVHALVLPLQLCCIYSTYLIIESIASKFYL